MPAKNPRKWRFTWEAQSHSPTLRLFLFDSQTKPSIQCKNLKVHLSLSQSHILVTWIEEDTEQVSLSIPIPKVLIDSESPVSFRALNDHIEVKLRLLLPVDHPIVSSFDSVLNISEDGENEASDVVKPLVMETDIKSLSSTGGVHFYCRSCSARLTRSPLRHFMEMPSANWREVADNWFGNCCCSFGGITEKLVTRYANSYTCAKGMCLLDFTTATLFKDDLVECKLLDWDASRKYKPEPDFAEKDGLREAMLDSGSNYGKVEKCDGQRERTNGLEGEKSFIFLKDDNLAAQLKCEVVEEETYGIKLFSALPETNFSENVVSEPGCCVHTEGCVGIHVDEVSAHDMSEASPMDMENQKSFLNGFLGNVFMARSSNLSADIEWIEFMCPHCSSLLGAYPFGNCNAPIDGGVRLFKCYISTSLPIGGSRDMFRTYTLEGMFTNQLLESAKDELSFRTVVRDLTTKLPMLQIVLLNPNSWCCTGQCFGTEGTKESVSKSNLHPAIKVLFYDCSNATESQLRMIEDWVTNNLADEVFMLTHQIEELIEYLASAKDMLPPSCTALQDFTLSTMKR